MQMGELEEELEDELAALKKLILQWNPDIAKQRHFVSRQVRLLQMKSLQHKLKDWENDRAGSILTEVEAIGRFIDTTKVDEQTRSVERLARLSAFCMPVGIITGFFGMNFAFLGIPDTHGILKWRYSQWLVLVLILASVQISRYITTTV